MNTTVRSLLSVAGRLGSLALCLGVAAAYAAPVYRITIVPPPPGHAGCQVLGLNDVGQVTGRCNSVGLVWSAASGSQAISDPAFPNAQFSPQAINNAGVVAGTRFETTETRNPAFTWSAASGFTYFGNRGKLWDVRDINDAGVVVGHSAIDDANFEWKAYRWTEAAGIEYLRPHANLRTLASGINQHGVIVGSYQNLDRAERHAVLYDSSGATTPLVPRSNWTSTGYAVNGPGHAVGVVITAYGLVRAFVWTPDAGAVNIDPRPGRSNESYAHDINDAGQVVGTMSWTEPDGNYADTAMYWDAATGMVDLLALLDPTDPLRSEVAGFETGAPPAINAQGQIVINAYGPDGETRPLLLTPLP